MQDTAIHADADQLAQAQALLHGAHLFEMAALRVPAVDALRARLGPGPLTSQLS